MIDDLINRIDELRTSYIDVLDVPNKRTNHKFYATEFNKILAKINEIRTTSNDIESSNIIKLSNILKEHLITEKENDFESKINEISSSLFGDKIKIDSLSDKTILDRINEVESIFNENIETLKEEINENTDEKIENSYNKLYTYITDTTLTFDYDVHTENNVQRTQKSIDETESIYEDS